MFYNSSGEYGKKISKLVALFAYKDILSAVMEINMSGWPKTWKVGPIDLKIEPE